MIVEVKATGTLVCAVRTCGVAFEVIRSSTGVFGRTTTNARWRASVTTAPPVRPVKMKWPETVRMVLLKAFALNMNVTTLSAPGARENGAGPVTPAPSDVDGVTVSVLLVLLWTMNLALQKTLVVVVVNSHT